MWVSEATNNRFSAYEGRGAIKEILPLGADKVLTMVVTPYWWLTGKNPPAQYREQQKLCRRQARQSSKKF